MECVICYEETLEKLSCKHIVCKDCLSKLHIPLCPMCRRELDLPINIALRIYRNGNNNLYLGSYVYNFVTKNINNKLALYDIYYLMGN